jgi:hypothetical protein
MTTNNEPDNINKEPVVFKARPKAYLFVCILPSLLLLIAIYQLIIMRFKTSDLEAVGFFLAIDVILYFGVSGFKITVTEESISYYSLFRGKWNLSLSQIKYIKLRATHIEEQQRQLRPVCELDIIIGERNNKEIYWIDTTVFSSSDIRSLLLLLKEHGVYEYRDYLKRKKESQIQPESNYDLIYSISIIIST